MRSRPPTIWIAIVAALAAFALLPAAGAQAQTGRFVALGDSDPAGSGLPPYDGAAPANCFRSVNGAPRLAAQQLGTSDYADTTCAAATIDDLWNTQYVFGQATNPPQLGALRGSEAIVTLTIGDNDSDVTSVTDHCLSSSDPNSTPCHDQFGDSGLSSMASSIAGDLASALDAIHARAPQAKIFLVGYPRMLPPDVSSCWGRINVTAADAPLVTGWQQTINETQKSVAAAHGAVFVDLFNAWSPGRDGCSSAATAWVKPKIDPPNGWALHPTLLGQQQTAALLTTAIKVAGLWSAPVTVPAAPGAGSATTTIDFTRLRPVIGARYSATLRRPRHGGGRVKIRATASGTIRLRLERKRYGRVVGGRCRVSSHDRHARRCASFRSWGAATSLRVRRGSVTIWLTGSSHRHTARSGIYRLKYSFDGQARASRQFKVSAPRRR